MKTKTGLIALIFGALFAVGLSSCSKATAQDETAITIKNPTLEYCSVATTQLVAAANNSQCTVLWKIVDNYNINIFEKSSIGELVKVGECKINPDGSYTVLRYNNKKELIPLFTTYYASAIHKPQNK